MVLVAQSRNNEILLLTFQQRQMIHNTHRNGNFTSSEIVKLTKMDRSGKKFGEAANTYMAETNFERYLGQSIDCETNARALGWGKLLEPRVHELLPISYSYSSDITDVHPTIPYWAGSKDCVNTAGEKAIGDIKCPITKKSFVQLVLPMYLGYAGLEIMYAIRDGFNHEGFEYPAHKDGPKYYWQIVSNAIINGADFGELIVYMPYDSELLEIVNSAQDNPALNWIKYASADEIPSIKDGGFFKNLNVIRFKIPQADKDFLTERVLKAGESLIQPTNANNIAA